MRPGENPITIAQGRELIAQDHHDIVLTRCVLLPFLLKTVSWHAIPLPYVHIFLTETVPWKTRLENSANVANGLKASWSQLLVDRSYEIWRTTTSSPFPNPTFYTASSSFWERLLVALHQAW
jgi:hypothetical protein